ncbi:MAG: DHHW family protein [Erysipelotrichaceae bacterium]|nr:DHHW family protein [Erysipelotrichaceae bacterium]
MKEKTLQKICIAVFSAYIGVLSCASVLSEKKTFSENENRSLAPAPKLTMSALVNGEFDEQFETWFSDHFIFRDFWIESKAASRKAAGSIENNDVYFGKQGKLIRRFASYPQKTLAQNISAVNKFAQDNNITANVLLVPTAADMDKDSRPGGAWDIDQTALLDEIGQQMASQNFIRIDEQLSQADDVYFRTDHHWNHNGALIGYRAIAENVLHKEPEAFTFEQVSDSFKGTMYSRSGAFWTEADDLYRIVPSEEYDVRVVYDQSEETDSIYSEKRLSEKDQYTYYVDGNHAYTEISADNGKGNTALIIKDSYSHILIPFLVQEYEHIILIDLRYWHAPVSGLIDENTDLYVIYSLDNFAQDPSPVLLR